MTCLHYIGVPRIGPARELKWAIERYWQQSSTLDDLLETARILRQIQWQRQLDSGAAFLSVGDFAWYDHVLEQSVLFNVIPERFRAASLTSYQQTVFAIARGVTDPTGGDLSASPMRKWFDTNYHYLVPEWDANTRPALNPEPLLEQVQEARAIHSEVKVQLAGPATYLSLSDLKGIDKDTALDRLIPVYQELLEVLAKAGVAWVQLDEPVLCTDIDSSWRSLIERAYSSLAASPVKLLVATYFGGLEDNLSLAAHLPVAGLHVDLVSAPDQLPALLDRLGPNKVLSAGIINGRNIWRANLDAIYQFLQPVRDTLGDRLWISSSCSLLHVPYNTTNDTTPNPAISLALAFMAEKQDELQALSSRLNSQPETRWQTVFDHSRVARETLSGFRKNAAVSSRVASIQPQHRERTSAVAIRKKHQQATLELPLLPTTTIGSFPQTAAIREARKALKQGLISQDAYNVTMEVAIADAIERQEKLGLDVLVHGEPERNDMVEYFGDSLAGFTTSRNGWVQSYGTRCVKPPIIYGDVYRERPLTLAWAKYAQSLTQRPVKGMLTGPTTMVAWAFVREDLPTPAIADQIALALRDEINDLEAAGIRIIQVDEPALREKLPLRKQYQRTWLDHATAAFRLATGGAATGTQIHTHMCYSQFKDILYGIKALDADVITIEAARSEMELVADLVSANYEGDIGPGVYDIHSPLVPQPTELVRRLEKALETLPAWQLWVNPDCGLKTRQWPEVEGALAAMVEAARIVRANVEASARKLTEADEVTSY